ncbi:MAG: hypothetical protein HC813_03350, partial [Planctomycetes bacterium]|nr:hypothetical protein [Planctomycetota bacterium]
MWPAPTAEDWEKPCLITWQRSWEDALAVSKETGKPILVCINMDGEIASEHYAGVRYRQPDIAALYEPYVTVIASVYRHNPRDFDDEGRRIPCPRFGCVTCGEHIAIEPVIFEKFCDGRRIAPRHIAVDLEGNETYDVFYRNDTASVFADIRDKVPESRPPETPIVRGDRPILERVKSRHIEDRVAVEQAYREGDAAMRGKLLEAAFAATEAAPLDLLRLAIFGMDVGPREQGAEALAHDAHHRRDRSHRPRRCACRWMPASARRSSPPSSVWGTTPLSRAGWPASTRALPRPRRHSTRRRGPREASIPRRRRASTVPAFSTASSDAPNAP